jgi:rubrerythrin
MKTPGEVLDLLGICCDGGIAEGLIAARAVLDAYEEAIRQNSLLTGLLEEAERRAGNLESAWDEQYCVRCGPESEEDERCPGCGADRSS